MHLYSLFAVAPVCFVVSCQAKPDTDRPADAGRSFSADEQITTSDATLPEEAGSKMKADAGRASWDAAVPEAVIPSGTTCGEALRLSGPVPGPLGRPLYTAAGDTSGATGSYSRSDCASEGKELHYQLDLTQRLSESTVHIRVEAEFDASLSVASGECSDLNVLGCSEDHAEGIQNPFLALQLPPGMYTLIVDGENSDDAGEFKLFVELAGDEPVSCSARPSNNTCAGAIELDPELPHQLVLGSTLCATDNAAHSTYCQSAPDNPPDVFYALDLSDNAGPVLLHANTDLPGTTYDNTVLILDEASGTCFQSIACNDDLRDVQDVSAGDLWIELLPGYYYIAVDGWDSAGDFALSVNLSHCTETNDTCAAAVSVDPSPGHKQETVNLGCMDGHRRFSGEIGPFSDAFYQLDLSGYAERAHLKAEVTDPASAKLALLSADGETCGHELYSSGIDLYLKPAVYYLAVFADYEKRGPVTLDIELAPFSARGSSECVNEDLSRCAEELKAGCCGGDLPACLLAYERCGLDPAVLNCVCETQPDCCTPPLTFGTHCGDALLRCEVFCPGFDPALYCGTE